MSWIAAGVGAGLGALKSDQDEKNYLNQMKLAATTQRWSPWSGIKAQMPNIPNPYGPVLQYGAAGAALGQGIKNAQGGSMATASGAANTNAITNAGNSVALDQSPWSATGGPNANALGTYNYQVNPYFMRSL